MPLRKAIQFLATLWLTVIASIMVSVTVERYAPAMEGRYFPVVSVATLTNVEIVSPTLTRVWLKSKKLRDCSYSEIEWWYGKQPPGDAARISVVFEGGPVIRPVGDMSIGPWLVAMPAETLINESFAYVTHRCHVLWNTRTLFYDSEDSPM